MPMRPRRTSPYSMIWSMTARAMLIGTAKPMPTLPPLGARIAVLMPISSPAQVDQRAARIAGIDRGVGLDEVLIALDAETAAPERADDARGDGLAEAERIADRHHVVTDLQPIAVAERHRRGAPGRGSGARRCRFPDRGRPAGPGNAGCPWW